MNRKGAEVTSLYQATQLQLWIWTKLFGTKLLPWFLLETGCYAAAGALLTDFLRKFYQDFGWKNALPIAFWSSILSLIAPHNAEVAVWKASYHYPVAVLLLCGILLLMRNVLFTGSRASLFFMILLYAVATFTLELFYAILPLSGLMVWLYYRKDSGRKHYYKNALISLALILVLFVMHFFLYHLVYRDYIPHLQTNIEAFSNEPVKAMGRLLHQEYHLLLQGRYWPQELRVRAYDAVNTVAGGGCALLFLVLALGVSFFGMMRRPRQAPLFWLTAAAVLGLLFILPFWVVDFGIYYNDRYLYFTGLFQWQLVAILIFRLRDKVATITAFLLTVVLLTFTLYTALQLRRSAKVFWQALETYRWKTNKGPVILLNMPANLKGIIFYQESPDESTINTQLQLLTGDSARAHPQVVAGFNMEDKEDGARVLAVNDSVLYVTLIRPGLWYWNGTLGAANHENNCYKIELDEWAHQYKLTLKDTSALLLYFNRGTWKEVNKALREAEQE